jgi:hypothetical protein
VIVRFTIRATRRKARDSNPHSPKGGRFSNAVRRTISGYLPRIETDSGPTGSRTRTSATPGRCPPTRRWARLTIDSGRFAVTSARSDQWTAGELNPDLRRAIPASSRWTSSPIHAYRVDRRGVEPRFPGCKPGVVPLDQPPISTPSIQRSARESNSVHLLTMEACRRRTRGPSRAIRNKVRPRVELGPPLYKRGMRPAHPQTIVWV